MKKLTTPTTVYEDKQYFYVTDHLGSSAWVTDRTCFILQHIQYLPFGEIFINQETTARRFENDFKFLGKELDSETGYTKTDNRYYWAEAGVFLSVDPLAEARAWISPYNYSQNNPVGRKDPTGRLDDGYTVDKKGKIERVDNTGGKDFDVLYNKEKYDEGLRTYNDIGDANNGLKLDRGILNNKKNYKVTSNGKIYNIDIYDIKGDERANNFLKFLAKNTNVEWSQTMIGTTVCQSNKISTSHLESSEAGQGYIFNKGYTIRGHDHNHPYSNIPSGNDLKWAEKLNDKFPDAVLRILYQNTYYQYDKSGRIFNSDEYLDIDINIKP